MAKQGSMIRDLIINVKSNDLSKTATEAERLVKALVDAAEGGEMLKNEFAGVKTSLAAVNKAANSTLNIFNNFALNDKFKSSLNQVLEGVNRINAAAKSLKGLDIGISLKVDNLTQLQQSVSKSIQGLDISINIKAGNLSATNDRMQALVTNMQDAAAGVELLNAELNTTKLMMASIKTDADAAAISLTKVAISKKLESGLDDVVASLQLISEEITQLNLDSQESFGKMNQSLEHVDDSLGAVNKTLHQTKFATKDVGKNTKTLVDEFSNVGKSSKDMGQKVSDATRGMRNQSRVMGDLAKIAGPLPAAYAMIAANVWALTSAFEYLASGDQLNRLESIGTTIGAEVGLPIQKLARDMVEATNGAISYEEALRKAANASGYGFSSKELEKMTEVARRASVVMGVDMGDALNRIIKGVSKQEIELLDELGITVRLTEAQSDYAKQLNVSSDALTSTQKKTAYLNAVLKQSEESFGYLTDKDLGATNIEKLGAAVSSLSSRFAQLMATGINWMLEGTFNGADKSIKEANDLNEGLKDILKSLDEAKRKGKISSELQLGADALSNYDEVTIRITELKKEVESGTVVMGGYKNEVYGINESYSFLTPIANSAAIAIKELTKLQSQQRQLAKELTTELGYSNINFDKQIGLIYRLAEVTKTIRTTQKSAKDGIESFRTSIREQQTPIVQYINGLKDITGAYEQLDKLKVDFPEIPNNVINKLEEYAAAMAKASGFASRSQATDALLSATKYKEFKTNVIDKEPITSANTSLRGMGDISGAAELTNSERILENKKQQLKINMDNIAAGRDALLTDEEVKTLTQAIAEGELEVAKARQALAVTSNQLNVEDSRRNNLFMEYSRMSSAEYSVRKLMNDLTDAENLLDIQNSTDVALEQRYQTETEILQLKAQIRRADIEANLAEIDRLELVASAKTATETYLNYMNGVPTAINEAASAQDRLNAALDRQRVITEAFNKGDSGYKEVDVLNADLAVEQARLAKVQAVEAAIKAEADKDSLTLQIQIANQNLGELEVAKNQELIEAKHLQNLKDAKASQTEILNQTLAEAEARRKIADIENERHRDMVQGGINAISGENQTQYTSTTGMGTEAAKLASNSDKLANVANSFDQLASYDQPFANVAANLSQMAIAIQDNAGAMEIASMAGQTITSMFQMNGQAAVDAIDAQIAAEKKRDGTSEESLAKIKALEAKKIETTRKTARQTIIMQTAVGVANALAMGNPMIGIPMAIAVGAMGLQALKAADSAAESSLAGLDSTTTTGSLTLGDRTNKVDTAQTANAGELSYIQGASGIGGIQNFTPRASGGNANAGYSYIAGEKGPELITPKVDSIVSDAQTTRNSSGSSGSVELTVHAIDARSFQDLVYSNPQIFKDAVEMTLNQQGKTLSKL